MGYCFERQSRYYNIKNNSKHFKESNRKPNKIWADKGRKFYYRSKKSWLEKYAIEMNLTHNEEKSVVAERFIATIKDKIY